MDRRLNAFQVTAECGSVSRAATKLGLTQSALSKVLRRLEDDFGAKLLERHPRGVRPSAAGFVLLRRAERAALEIEHAREEIASLDTNGPAVLRIAAGPIYLLDWIRQPIKNIARRHPSLSFSITSSGSDIALSKLLKSELDAFLGYVDPGSITENLDCVTIGKVSVHAYGPRASRLELTEPKPATAVSQQPWVYYAEAAKTNERLRDFWVRNYGVEPSVKFNTNSMNTALALAADNGCWICLPSPLAGVAARYGLRQIKSKRAFWEYRTGCIVRRSSLGYHTIREFIDVIRATVGSVR